MNQLPVKTVQVAAGFKYLECLAVHCYNKVEPIPIWQLCSHLGCSILVGMLTECTHQYSLNLYELIALSTSGEL